MRDLHYDMGDPEMKQRATLLTRAAKENPDWEKLRDVAGTGPKFGA